MGIDVRKDMKAEINNENKAKFFALYWGQEFFEWKYPEHATSTCVIKPVLGFIENYTQCGWLNLKPLSQITDEDAFLISKLIGVYMEDVYDWLTGDCMHEDFQNPFTFLHATDYLRFKGYAIEWMGLSVEEMLEAGWIKLVE